MSRRRRRLAGVAARHMEAGNWAIVARKRWNEASPPAGAAGRRVMLRAGLAGRLDRSCPLGGRHTTSTATTATTVMSTGVASVS
jgi:hypothetical protein